MGILRKFREWREDKDGTLIGPDIEAESVNTGGININGASFIQAGDIDIKQMMGSGATQSTSSSSYSTYDPDNTLMRLQWDDVIPTGAQGYVVGWAAVDNGSDALDIRFKDNDNSKIIFETTGITNTLVRIGAANYTPPNPSTPTNITAEFRNQDNTTTVSIFNLGYAVGVKL